MKLIINLNFMFALSLFILLNSCSKTNDNTIKPSTETTKPEILSLISKKSQIFGISDATDIVCNAKGGNLIYKWEVDLGDIIPQGSDHSKIKFSGAACCEGDKEITCTVSNDKGSVSKTVIVKIIPEIRIPAINDLSTDLKEIHYGTNEIARFNCFAIGGGNIKYEWAVDCGKIIYPTSDSSKVQYLATEACKGNRFVSCKISNEKGEDTKSIQINVYK
ncbi:MAG: hypothetical protein NTW25_01540 [Candidatus Kapabacteria bacterium]|nr:hypothetical protein [Candidatus Kapabacteria bacterium]